MFLSLFVATLRKAFFLIYITRATKPMYNYKILIFKVSKLNAEFLTLQQAAPNYQYTLNS
jgi:hypothetical protein